jgi:DNA-directed RNA polymerase beta subunit
MLIAYIRVHSIVVFQNYVELVKKQKNPWVFEPEYPEKSRMFDGKMGDPFEQHVLIGKSYIFKLIHQVVETIHGSSTRPSIKLVVILIKMYFTKIPFYSRSWYHWS